MPALITSRDPKGIHATGLFEAVYNKAKLDEVRAQRLNENGGEFQEGILELINRLSVSNQFANEETKSNYTYPSEYKGPKPIQQQIAAIADIFKLDPANALEFAKNLPELPAGAEGWFAVPSMEALTKMFPGTTDLLELYCQGIRLIHEKLVATRSFYNYREGKIDTQHLRMHVRTVAALTTIQEVQNGDILIIAAQLGMRHRGRSTRRAREVFTANEYGLGSVMGCSIALTHPERFVRSSELDMDLPGDEFAPGGDGQFGRAPLLLFGDDRLGFIADDCGRCDGGCGSASGFLPQ